MKSPTCGGMFLGHLAPLCDHTLALQSGMELPESGGSFHHGFLRTGLREANEMFSEWSLCRSVHTGSSLEFVSALPLLCIWI